MPKGDDIKILIYFDAIDLIEQTIDDIRRKTPPHDIIICNDTGTAVVADCKVLSTDRIGYAAAINAAMVGVSEDVIIATGPLKVSENWLEPLQQMAAAGRMVCPVTANLDTVLWNLQPTKFRRVGWRYDFSIYDRPYVGSPSSPSASPCCFLISGELFNKLGGFDGSGMCNHLSVIDLSLHNWLFGGEVVFCDDSIVGGVVAATSVDLNHASRIIHKWCPQLASAFYNYNGLKGSDPGRLPAESVDSASFMQRSMPELCRIYELCGSAAGKTVAIVGDGPSLDFIDSSVIGRHDIIISVGSVAELVDFDFVVASNLLDCGVAKHAGDRAILPMTLFDGGIGRHVSTIDLFPDSVVFEQALYGVLPVSAKPPFCNFDDQTLTAAQFALFLRPKSITVFGCDYKLLFGRSHAVAADMWNDPNASQHRFAALESAMRALGLIAAGMGVPLFRMNHA